MFLVTKWFGIFLYENKEITQKILFEKNEKEIYKKLLKIENKEILSEEIKIVKKKNVIVNEKRLEKIGTYDPSNPFFKKIDLKSEDFGFTEDLLNKASIIFTKKKVEKKLSSDDLQVIQMINALDDLIQTSNLLSERLECWSVLPNSKEKIKPLKKTFKVVNDEIKSLEKQINQDMADIAPNITNITGSVIGARLISYAGGLEKLAMFPASTIQVLGAEKALFRFKKEGGKPPKHGVIFQNSYINKSAKKDRGKIARILSAKISIAARADAFTKREISDILIEELNRRVKEIKS